MVEARVVGFEADKDIAVLKMEPRSPAAQVGPLIPVEVASAARADAVDVLITVEGGLGHVRDF